MESESGNVNMGIVNEKTENEKVAIEKVANEKVENVKIESIKAESTKVESANAENTELTARGKTVVLGNNIDTDQIYPGRYLALVKPEEIKEHCLEGCDPAIHTSFKKGDIIVAGTNFGCGSSREHAVIALMHMGAGVILADSFARIFYRNSFNLGLPLLICKGISKEVNAGDELEVGIESGTVRNLTQNKSYQCECIGDYALDILKAGGIKPLMRRRVESGEFENKKL